MKVIFPAVTICSFISASIHLSKRGKVDPKIVPKSIQIGANLAKGVGKGYPIINIILKK
jgi:hypothetical protein